MNRLATVVGKLRDDPEVTALINELDVDEDFDASPDGEYVVARASGLVLLFEEKRVSSVQLNVRPVGDYSSYVGELPFGLNASLSRDEISKVLGEPSIRRENADLYRHDNYKVFIQFSKASEMVKVFIEPLDTQP